MIIIIIRSRKFWIVRFGQKRSCSATVPKVFFVSSCRYLFTNTDDLDRLSLCVFLFVGSVNSGMQTCKRSVYNCINTVFTLSGLSACLSAWSLHLPLGAPPPPAANPSPENGIFPKMGSFQKCHLPKNAIFDQKGSVKDQGSSLKYDVTMVPI